MSVFFIKRGEKNVGQEEKTHKNRARHLMARGVGAAYHRGGGKKRLFQKRQQIPPFGYPADGKGVRQFFDGLIMRSRETAKYDGDADENSVEIMRICLARGEDSCVFPRILFHFRSHGIISFALRCHYTSSRLRGTILFMPGYSGGRRKNMQNFTFYARKNHLRQGNHSPDRRSPCGRRNIPGGPCRRRRLHLQKRRPRGGDGVTGEARHPLRRNWWRPLEPQAVQARDVITLLKEKAGRARRGRGSVFDTAKAAAMGALYDGDVWDFFCGKAAVKPCPSARCSPRRAPPRK